MIWYKLYNGYAITVIKGAVYDLKSIFLKNIKGDLIKDTTSTRVLASPEDNKSTAMNKIRKKNLLNTPQPITSRLLHSLTYKTIYSTL